MAANVREMTQRLMGLTAGFCACHLNDEYRALCEKLILKMARKRHVPFETGSLEIWASGVVHALCNINAVFDKGALFDRSPNHELSVGDICKHFDVSSGSVALRSKAIRDMFKLARYDCEFSTARMLERRAFKAALNRAIAGLGRR